MCLKNVASGWIGDKTFAAYLEAALLTSDHEGVPMYQSFSSSDFDKASLLKMYVEFRHFEDRAVDFVHDTIESSDDERIEDTFPDDFQMARDFWYTRNGHGAGFWDGDWAVDDIDIGDPLTKMAEEYSEIDLFVEDGKIFSYGTHSVKAREVLEKAVAFMRESGFPARMTVPMDDYKKKMELIDLADEGKIYLNAVVECWEFWPKGER